MTAKSMRIFWRNVLIAFSLVLALTTLAFAKPNLPVREISQLFQSKSFFEDGSLDALTYFSEAKDLAELRRYLKELDPYATYTTKRDRDDLSKMVKAKPASIGMDIFRDRSGRVRCVPYPSSPAAHLGILYGDELQQIDDQPVMDLTMEEIASLIRGEADTEVQLLVQRGKKQPRWVTVVREESSMPPTVLFYHQKKRPIMWILRFGPKTDQELLDCLARFPEDERLVLDLRGNTGGNLAAAIKCAKLFLPRGSIVAKIQTRSGLKVVRADKDGEYADISLIMRQDRYTASAGEMFIAALLAAQRGTSVGEKTAGKALVQTLFTLKGGGILKLSTEKLLNLEGSGDWEGKGLLPTRSTSKSD